MAEGPEPALVLYTVGHGTVGRERPAGLLAEAGITPAVDVRTAPGSRRDPDLARAGLARWLPGHGIGYRWEKALDGVLGDAARTATAVMCSEAVWWRCHRRLIADAAVLTAGADALRLMHDGRLVPHRPTPGARLREDGLLVYDDLSAAGVRPPSTDPGRPGGPPSRWCRRSRTSGRRGCRPAGNRP